MKIFSISLLILTVGILSSCASKTVVTQEKVSHGDALLDKYASNHGYQKVGGVVRSGSDEESSFAGKRYGGNTGDFAGKDYTTNQYASKRWGSKKSLLGAKSYTGSKEFSNSPDFVKQQAYYAGLKSNSNGVGYTKNGYAVSKASETNSSAINKKDSSYANMNDVKDPVIVPWQQQGTLTDNKGVKNVSVTQTRALLGRSTGE